MGNSPLDFPSSEGFRKKLVVRNLVPYKKSPTNIVPPINYPTIQRDIEVIDSDDNLIDVPTLANKLYPRNQFGPSGGYIQTRDPNSLNNTHSNEGEYGPGQQDAKLLQVSVGSFKDALNINAYGDGQGNRVVDSGEFFVTLDPLILNSGLAGNAKAYPTTFLPSSYSPLSILLSNNPRGDNGSLSQDSYIVRLGAEILKKGFEERIATQIRRNTIGRANLFNANSGTDVLGMLTGRVPIIQPNYQITVVSNPVVAAADFALRLGGTYIPLSPIPGSYFDSSINPGQPTTIQQLQNAYNSTIGRTGVGQFLSALFGSPKSGSQLFLNNTGSGQKSILFNNLDYNRFKPGYDRNFFDRLSGAIVPGVSNNSDYYIGSENSEPSRILTPSNENPVDAFGKEMMAEVYGAQVISQLYEGDNSGQIKLGANGPTYSNGGGVEGGFTWVSPKYKDNAGKKVGVGGEIIRDDNDFKESSFLGTESTNLQFKQGSILDETQRLIDSQPKGGKRLQHVGNAIDQVSKVFNDGYKELTKGSRVLSYIGEIGQEKGAEYCRVFAKDTPYLQYNDLQKTDGITTEGRRFSYSVLDKTYNLNMYPNKQEGGRDSTNLIGSNETGKVKKYMFSLENLAWRTSNRPGYTYSDLPICERGPNGGRIMWFPPYDLKFNENINANWKGTDFLGRPEPVYTYNNTTRTGTISWKIIVDHPSALNLIVNKVLANESNKVKVDSILESFFAGCRKYDLYELAKKYYTVNPNDLFEIQKEIQYKEVSKERIDYIKKEQTTGVAGTEGSPDTQKVTPVLLKLQGDYVGKGVYFPNDIPKPGQDFLNYNSVYSQYMGEKATYPFSCETFFNNVVTPNYNEMEKLAAELNKLIGQSTSGSVTIVVDGSASAPAKIGYNEKLSTRRINSLITFFQNNPLTAKLYNNKLFIKPGKALGEGATDVSTSQYDGKSWTVGQPYSCTDGDGVTPSKEITTVNAMSCRRAVIKSIDTNSLTFNDNVEIIPGKKATESTLKTESFDVEQKSTFTEKVPQEVTKTVLRDNITKRVLRGLLSECDYFETIKEETPMVYDSLKEKLKFFNPAFHSMTPEGLNSRLTFLQQCLRPGDTIPTVKKGGDLVYNDAINTAFGAPPVLILRVGDFWHSKIIPDGITLSYENLDLNPEGIGIQPMIANVSLNFKFVGGQGLAAAVDKLQNAISFNYYANTEIYDDRSDVTDSSYKVLDKDFLDYFNITVPPPVVNDVPNINGQDNSKPIGVVTSAVTTSSGETGDINYQAFFNGFVQSTKNYFTTVLNKNKEVFRQYNNAMLQIWGLQRSYTKGRIIYEVNTEDVDIYGKPENFESIIQNIFSDYINDIDNETDGLIQFVRGTNGKKNFSEKLIRALKTNYKNYINSRKNTFQSALTTIIQDLVKQEQSYGLDIARVNVITYRPQNNFTTDGYQEKNGFVKLYYTLPKPNGASDYYVELITDIKKIKTDLNSFNSDLSKPVSFKYDGKEYTGKTIYTQQEYIKNDVFKQFSKNGLMNQNTVKRAYFILNDVIIDKNNYDKFKNGVLGDILKNPSLFQNGDMEIEKEFDGYWNTVKPSFIEENNLTQTFLNESEKTVFQTYLTYPEINPTSKREFTFTTNTPQTETTHIDDRSHMIKSLGATSNEYKNTDTFTNIGPDGETISKVKFN